MSAIAFRTMDYFDCNASFGVSQVPLSLKQAFTAEELLQEMEFCGVREALVYHAAMRDDDPSIGNALLSEAIRGHKKLHGSWAIAPSQTGEQDPPTVFLTKMRRSGIKALRAFPSKHRYLLDGLTFGKLFRLMVKRRIPLFLSVTESSGGRSGWAMIEQLLLEFPRLILVATDHGPWGDDRFFRPLLDRFKGLHIDTSRYELDGGISNLCDRYGAKRILFGTGFPVANMGGALLTLSSANISKREKEMIASGNLRRILEGSSP
ncbi:MAG: amidohydrolase family protein [Thermoproteota archaeon]